MTMKSTKKLQYLLLLIVFLTGGSLLVIEVAAVRILSPYFGNTMYTFSSVISTVLAALSIGYFVGGKYADKHPYLNHFFTLILLSGLGTLLATAFAVTLLPALAYSMSMVTGPLVWSVALFVVPSIFLGMLSPFVIKLEQKFAENEGIGSLSGKVFFWSTLGSITGSLLAGFVLIPHFGVQESMTGVSLLLIAMGLAGVLYSPGRKGHKILWVAAGAAVLIQSAAMMELEPQPEGIVYMHDGLYERITVIDKQYKGRKARFLLQDRNLSSAEFLDGDGVPFDYVAYHQLHSLLIDDMEDSLVIGAGAYTVPRLLWDETQAHIDVVDIEPELKPLSETYFKLDKDLPIHHHFTDGRRFLHDSERKYDLIFNDAYGSNLAVPAHLTTQEFFALSKDKLEQDGIFLGNFIGSLAEDDRSFMLSAMKTFRSVYPNSTFFAVSDPNTDRLQNVMYLGINGDKAFDPCDSQYTSSGDAFVSSMCSQVFAIGNDRLAEHFLFTDNHAPIEYLTAQSLKYMNES